jgi:DNA-binding transcriptional ArsR family regulator
MKFDSFNPYLNHKTYHLFFSNLANPLRIGIILSLKNSKKNVKELSKDLMIEQSKLSHSLKSLKNCKIVEVDKKGKERIYSLNKKIIIPMLNLIEKHVHIDCKCECCILKGTCKR